MLLGGGIQPGKLLTMRIFESHCHIDDPCYMDDLDAVIQRARSAEVRAMMVVGIDGPSSKRAVHIADQYPGVFASVGFHPHDAKACSENTLSELKLLANHDKVKAWGETGLDFNRMFSPQKVQEHWLVRQLETAQELGLSMIFHERESQGRFLEILHSHWGPQCKGVVHCFSGNEAELDAYLDLGMFIGITGILTMQARGESLRRMAKRIPADRLLVETDAPYLTPVPERNKSRRNEPAFVRTVLVKLAAVRQEDLSQLAAAIWSNTCSLFGLPEDS
jgi:TatD DNase family protein